MRYTTSNPRPLPSAKRLRELFDYNPLTGELIHRTNRGGVKAGEVAGNADRVYRRLTVDGCKYLAHRLVWAWVHGNDPTAVIHHKRSDKRNTIWDLEDITHRKNCSMEKVEASGLPVGVYWHAAKGLYMARIKLGKRCYYLGCFDTPQEASECYQRALSRVEQGLPPEPPPKEHYHGTALDSRRGKWQARIVVDGKQLHLGYFTDRDEAIEARIAAEIEHWGAPLPRKKKP